MKVVGMTFGHYAKFVSQPNVAEGLILTLTLCCPNNSSDLLSVIFIFFYPRSFLKTFAFSPFDLNFLHIVQWHNKPGIKMVMIGSRSSVSNTALSFSQFGPEVKLFSFLTVAGGTAQNPNTSEAKFIWALYMGTKDKVAVARVVIFSKFNFKQITNAGTR